MPNSRLARRKGSKASGSSRNVGLLILLTGILIIILGVCLLYWQTLQSLQQQTNGSNNNNLRQQVRNTVDMELEKMEAKEDSQGNTLPDNNIELDKEQPIENLDPRHLPRDDDFRPGQDDDQDEHNQQHGKETLVLQTDLGAIRITLKPEYSAESVEYIRNVVATGDCQQCSFYRAEQKGILQGIVKSQEVPIHHTKGSCPPGFENVHNDCPAWDNQCGCHGPLMQRGYVAWAAGKTGPDFFIDDYRRPAEWWGTQHTVWGQIEEESSLNVIQEIWKLPAQKKGGLTYLDKRVRFTMRIDEEALVS